MKADSYFSKYCREKNRNRTGLDVQNDQWLDELGDMIVATVEGAHKANPDSYFYEYCREKTRKHIGLNFQNSQWLEELGNMFEAAVAGISREQSFSDDYYGSRASA